MSRPKSRRIISEINITPLTDIFLVLLIIMMVIAPMLDSQGLKLAVPSQAPADQSQTDPKILVLKVLADGQFQVDGEPTSAEQLRSTLTQMKNNYPDGLMIQAEGKAPHGYMVKAMDAARGAGIDKIAVSTTDDGGEQ